MADQRDGQGRHGEHRGGRDQRDEHRDGRGRTRSGSRGAGGERHLSSQRPGERSRRSDPARLAAWRVMRAVDDGAYANLELPGYLRRNRIEGRDASFATELTYGTIRHQGLYDAIIADGADRAVSAIDPEVLTTLRLGAHQLLDMRVPDHAAVGETVALSRQVNGAGAAGFVNAVLRRVAERSLAQWQQRVVPDPTSIDGLALATSHPAWQVRALRAALLGNGAATPDTIDTELRTLLESDNTPARVTLVARPGLAERDELLDAGATPTRWSPYGAVLDRGDPGTLPAVRDGRAAVQDEGSQLLPLILLAAPLVDGPREPGPERWLDLCAGPGGKAGLLAGLALERGTTLVANEVSEHRADLVYSTLSAAGRAGADLEVRCEDGREYGDVEPGRYDRVLVDAPCTGLGALRRRPEARWRRTEADVTVLTGLQRELLESALVTVRPGGVVGYATCSPHLPETRVLVEDVVKGRDDVEILDAAALLAQTAPDLDLGGSAPYVQLWPHRHDTDAMFLAVLRRR